MQITSMKAKPIETEGRYLILLFGPNAILKTAAAYLRKRHRDYTVNIRSTDNPADSYAEGTPCEMRIIIESGFSNVFVKMYADAGLSTRVMRWNGETLDDIEEGDGSADVPHASPQAVMHQLSSGEMVSRELAIARAAEYLNMTVPALMALDEKTISSSIELAYSQPKVPEPIGAQDSAVAEVRRKKKGK
jgi:hypothetical protein